MSFIVKKCPKCNKFLQDNVNYFQENMGYSICKCKREKPKIISAPQKPKRYESDK